MAQKNIPANVPSIELLRPTPIGDIKLSISVLEVPARDADIESRGQNGNGI